MRRSLLNKSLVVSLIGTFSLLTTAEMRGSEPEVMQVAAVERQPLEASVLRLQQSLQLAGSPLSAEELAAIEALRVEESDAKVIAGLQSILDQHCLAVVHINPESRVKTQRGPASAVLDQSGWTNFLVKVVNEAGVTAPLTCLSDQARPMVRRSSSSPNPTIDISPVEAKRRWLDIAAVTSQPMRPKLSGLQLEYRILQLYSRDAGSREATLSMHVGQGTQDLGFRSELPILFECRPSIKVPLKILDEAGKPTTCSLLIKDQQGRVYPNPSRRLAPDFFFHEQIYRNDGDSVYLAPGTYNIVAFRGPEYLPRHLELSIEEPKGASGSQEVVELKVQLERWIHMAKHGWFSGDHHVHAAGCAHYENPTEGVTPEDMVRHIVGEDLNVGCVLSWGPCWYYQKQFFDGKVSELSRPGNLMRYDVEVSGFPSSHAGHLCLLNLTEDDYPGTKSIEQWPTWTLPVLAWGKEQGGVVGYSHSGWGLALPDYLPNGRRGQFPRSRQGNRGQVGRAADKLPDYAMPPFDGIGANEYIVTTALGVCDFISAVDTPAIWELNIWYHTLNCGFTSRISGETDFPCIYGERVGLGRSYVQADHQSAEELTYEQWVQGLKAGRSYVGDGMSHLLHFSIDGHSLGQSDAQGRASFLPVDKAGKHRVNCTVAALLPEQVDASGKLVATRRLDEKPYWHLERARLGDSRKVPVELVVNGFAVQKKEILADGKPVSLEFDVDIPRSAWVAIRILPSMHTNPIFVEVGGMPIRASRKSAEWCREAVDVCWNEKSRMFRQEEIGDAKKAYDQARAIYEAIASECVAD